MCYKFKFLIGFSFAFLFMSASLPVLAMEEKLEKKSNSISRHIMLRSQKKQRNSKANKDTVQIRDRTREGIKHFRELKECEAKDNLKNQTEHFEKLKEVIIKKAKEEITKEITIYSEEVTDRFISELFISWVNRSKADLILTIYTTPSGEEIFKKATLNNEKFEINHTINIVSLYSFPSNILIMDQTLFVSTTYPWLTFPSPEREDRSFPATVICGERAKKEITKKRKELEEAPRAVGDSMGCESSESDEESPHELEEQVPLESKEGRSRKNRAFTLS